MDYTKPNLTRLSPTQLVVACYCWLQDQCFFYQHLAISQFELDDER